MKNVGGLTALYSIGIPQKNRQFFLVSFEKWTKYNNNTNKLHHQITVGIEKFQMLFEQNIASNVTRNAGAQTYKT